MDHYRIKTHSRSTSEEKILIDNHIKKIAQIIIKASENDRQVKRKTHDTFQHEFQRSG